MNYIQPNRGEPNRNVSKGIILEIIMTNPLSWIGFIFFFIGTLFFVLWIPLTDFDSLFFGDETITINGKIINISETNYYENDNRIYQFQYEYYYNQKKYTGSSYSDETDYEVSSAVVIERQTHSPFKSRIKGMRMGPSIFWALLFILIFPSVGLSILFSSIQNIKSKIMLLRHGIITTALVEKIITIEPKDKEEPIYYDTYLGFLNNNGEQINAKINISDSLKVKVGDYEKVVYFPRNPSICLYLKSFNQRQIALLLGK